MKPEVRPAIAFIVAKLAGNVRGGTVYDYSQSRYIYLSGEVGPRIAVYDHTAHAHITGSPSNLYHYGTQRYLSLSINGIRFTGYDYDSSRYFSGTVRRGNVELYDYDDSRYHQFHIT